MRRFIKKHPAPGLLLLCYGAALALLLLVHLGDFVANRVLYATGHFTTRELTVADFDLENLIELDDGRLVSTTADPQMLLKDPAQKVDTVYLELQTHLPARATMVFYARDRQYTMRQVLYGTAAGGGLSFYLPSLGGASLRVDPVSVESNIITIERIVINQPRPVYAFFVFSANEWLALALLPGLLACGISILWQGRALLPRYRKAGDAAS